MDPDQQQTAQELQQQQQEDANVSASDSMATSVQSSAMDTTLKSMCNEYGRYLDFPELSNSQV